jgi:hypothetical protein
VNRAAEGGGGEVEFRVRQGLESVCSGKEIKDRQGEGQRDRDEQRNTEVYNQ